MGQDLKNLPLISAHSANIVILTWLKNALEHFPDEKFEERTGIAPDNLLMLKKARNKQLEILSENLRYARARNE